MLFSVISIPWWLGSSQDVDMTESFFTIDFELDSLMGRTSSGRPSVYQGIKTKKEIISNR